MSKKPTLTSLTSGYLSTTAINDNFNKLLVAFDNTVSRDGSTPNTMEADFDLNGNDINNAKDLQVTGNFTYRGQDISDLLIGVGPATVFNTTNRFTGDGSTTDFSLTKSVASRANTFVYLDGVYQFKNTYTATGSTLSFDEAPASGVGIEVVMQEGIDVGTVDASSVSYQSASISDALDSRAPEYDTMSDLIAETYLEVGQKVYVGGPKYHIVAGGTYDTNAYTVFDLSGTGYQAVLAPGEAVTNAAAMLADTREADWFTLDDDASVILTLDGHAYNPVSTGSHVVTAGSVGLKVLPSGLGYVFEAFGATGDGSTDETAAFTTAQAALSDGDTLLMRKSYNFATSIEITQAGLTLTGCGTITSDTDVDFSGILKPSADRVRIEGLTINSDASGVTRIGVEVVSGDGVEIVGNTINGCRYGILERAAATNCLYERNTYDNGTNGLTFIAVNGDGAQILNNRALAFGDSGVVVTNTAKAVQVLGNHLKARTTSNSTLGISVEEDVEDTLVDGNYIDGSWGGGGTTGSDPGLVAGIKLSDNNTGTCPTGVTVTNNIVSNVKNYAFFTINSGATRNVTDLVLQGNQAIGCGQDGYRLDDISNGEITGNIASGCGRNGFLVLSLNVFASLLNNNSHDSANYNFQIANFRGLFFGNRASGGGVGDYFLDGPTESVVFEKNVGLDAGLRSGECQSLSFYGSVGASTALDIGIDEVPDGASVYIDYISVYEDGVIDVPANLEFKTNSNLLGVLAGTVTHAPADEVVGAPIAYEANGSGASKYVKFRIVNGDASSHTAAVQVKYRILGGA